MKRWIILMTKENLAKCESGVKTQTRRDNERYAGIKKGDEIYFRRDYKTTYKTASGPYIAQADASWEDLQDINDHDAVCEGVELQQIEKVGMAYPHPTDPGRNTQLAGLAFQWLWESIYEREGARWDDNPRVLKI